MKLAELVAEPWLVAPETYRALAYAAAKGAPVKAAKAAARLPNPTQALQSLVSAGADPEAFLWLLAEEEEDSDLEVRDGVAVIPIHGFLTARSYWRGDRASYQWIGDAVAEAVERSDVQALLFDVDSAGGQVKGCDELATAIFEARREKPSTAVVRGEASSAAYWLASAARRVVCGRTSLLGSIGVVMTFLDFSKMDEAVGIEEIDIVSSQSPYKVPDPKEADARARIQTTVDELAALFVADVARNRGVSEQTVTSDFGEGWVLVGDAAVAAGMADETGTFEEVADRLGSNANDATAQRRGAEGGSMKTVNVSAITAEWLAENVPAVAEALREQGKTEASQAHEEALDAARAEARDEGAKAGRDEGYLAGVAAERDRVAGIEAAALPGHDELVAELKADPAITVEAANQKILAAEKKKRGGKLGALRQDEQDLDAPAPGAGGEGNGTSDRVKDTVATAERLGFGRRAQK